MALFKQIFAVDPNNPQNVAENGVISIYAPGTRDLLPITTVTGGPLSNPLQLNSRGYGPAFSAAGYTQVAWEAVAPGEVFNGTFESYEGVLAEAIAAKEEAAAGAAAEVAARVASGEFNGSDGNDGQDGRDGSNVIPTAQAIASEIQTPGTLANTALVAAIGKPLRAQTPTRLTATPVDDGGRTACWMDAARTRVFAAYRNILRYTDNDGTSWVDVLGLVLPPSKPIIAVRDLDNGEILVSAGGVGTQAEIWVSTGFGSNPQTATWRKTKTAASAGVYFANSWSFSVHKNIVLVNEYGPKAGGAGNARYCYLSLDYGQTWKTIFDVGTAAGNHLHGVCYDPYWDRIWLTYGDDTSAIMYSDNLGANWSTAQSSTVISGDFQSVGILALPGCVLFASDGQPNGVLRIPRTAGKAAGAYTPEVAYRLDNATQLTWLGHLAFRAQRAGDDAPALFAFSPELSTGKSKVLATVDGYTFTVVWEDPTETTNKGAITALGPTARGKLWIVESDDRQANFTKWVGPMPTGY